MKWFSCHIELPSSQQRLTFDDEATYSLSVSTEQGGPAPMKSFRPYPDLILYNGKIRTFAGENSICEALACGGGRIVAAGAADEVRGLAGPDTQTIDLKGRTTIPGLTDTHVHLSEKGTAEMKLVDCRDFYVGVSAIADILERLGKAAGGAPKGSGSSPTAVRCRTSESKTSASQTSTSTAPALTIRVSISFGAHVTIGNSKALATAKITATRRTPPAAILSMILRRRATQQLHERAQLILKKVRRSLTICSSKTASSSP
jgi:predicted amidohydrolase YtcJ